MYVVGLLLKQCHSVSDVKLPHTVVQNCRVEASERSDRLSVHTAVPLNSH